MKYAIYDSRGRILRRGDCEEQHLERQVNANEFLFVGEIGLYDLVDPATQQVISKPQKPPTPNHIFDFEKYEWVDPRSLDDLKVEQWEAIKKARELAEIGGFEWDGSVFDSDPISQSRILGANQLASITPDFEIEWTLADNTSRMLSSADIQAIGIALGKHIAKQHNKSRELRARIDQASSAEEVFAVSW